MTEIQTVLGSVVYLISLFAVVSPKRLLRAGQSVTITTPLRLSAFGVRLLLGIIITLVADSTQFPWTLQFMGILLFASGVTVLLTCNAKIQSLLDWLRRRDVNSMRAGGIADLQLGGFIIHAVA